jgi:HEAT repeats
LALIACSLWGCMDGPFYKMKEMNPYFRNQWKKDLEHGPTYTERFEELRVLDKQIASYSPDDQHRWLMQLEGIIQQDPSPEFRAECLKTVAKIQSPQAITALNRASADENFKVRIAACKAWKVQHNGEARDMLLSMAQSDADNSVRMAAIEALGVFQEDPEVRSAFPALMENDQNLKSPAIMYQIAQSMKNVTGRDYGGDFDSWKRYLNGEEVPEPPKKTMTADLMESLTPWR